ncbi:MAG: 3'-5' exonuclease, partial [Pseudomonadota bacterium]|nr:3'-5' exonuclease [Pseudomonadota bacterium]
VLTQALAPFYDVEESQSLVENAFRHQQFTALKYGLGKPDYPVSERKYGNWVQSLRGPLEEKYGVPLPEKLETALQQVGSMSPPDYTTLEAYKKLPAAFTRAREAMVEQLEQAAALQDVEPQVAAAYFDAYRDQYKKLYAGLPASQRPDAPAEWVDGSVGTSGFRKVYDSQAAPHDPASMYALYRLRSDPNAIPAGRKTRQGFVSVDLETALPDDVNYYLKPESGRIIEVGVRLYSPDGDQVGEYQTLVRPEQTFLEQHGTGAEHVHQISVGMLDRQPSWGEVKEQVAGLFEGRTLLAQNATFERTWLAHYMVGDDGWKPRTVDTLLISRKHYSLPNHNLANVCAVNGVEYTEGHRAL